MDPLIYHQQHQGKLAVQSKVPVETQEDLATAYSPGVAEPCRAIAHHPEDVYTYTNKANAVAIVTDGSAVLGLGNIGAKAALPVMEGKAILFKAFGGVDAYPICLDTQDPDEIIRIVEMIAPGFGGINLEDISAPRCFEIEQKLIKKLDIPVFHDDQHGTAIVSLAGLINASKVVQKNIKDLKVVVNGAGAAGIAITNLLLQYGIHKVILCDSRGIVHEERAHLNPFKKLLAQRTKVQCTNCDLAEALIDADAFIGVSVGNVLTEAMIQTMHKDAIVFAQANPTPEIMPEKALAAGAKVVGTGRSDFPNQVNNVLAFPGLFRGVLDARIRTITNRMKIAAAEAIANYVPNPTPECVLPSPLDKKVAQVVAKAVQP